jgi:hypothetical protein
MKGETGKYDEETGMLHFNLPFVYSYEVNQTVGQLQYYVRARYFPNKGMATPVYKHIKHVHRKMQE